MKKVNRFVYWTPRILSILFILFIAMFSLDVFSPDLTLSQMILGFLIHNIPTLILIIILIISWKYEIVGAIAFILAGLVYIVFLILQPEFHWYLISWSLLIAGPAFVIGILFLLNWKRKN